MNSLPVTGVAKQNPVAGFIATALSLLLLLALIGSVSPQIHERLYHSGSTHSGECLVCTFSSGYVHQSNSLSRVDFDFQFVSLVHVRFEHPPTALALFLLPPGRAPPAPISA